MPISLQADDVLGTCVYVIRITGLTLPGIGIFKTTSLHYTQVP